MNFRITDPLTHVNFSIDIPIENFETYAREIEIFLNSLLEEVIEDYLIDQKSYGSLFLKDMDQSQYFLGDPYRYGVELPNIMRKSLFFTIFAYLEHYLITLSKDIKRKKNLALDINEIQHKGIEKAQVYLKKVAGMKFPDHLPEWNYIKRCNKIRNILIHSGGFIDSNKNNSKLIQELKSVKGLELVERKNISALNIYLREPFCFEFIKSMKIMLRELSKEIFIAYELDTSNSKENIQPKMDGKG